MYLSISAHVATTSNTCKLSQIDLELVTQSFKRHKRHQVVSIHNHSILLLNSPVVTLLLGTWKHEHVFDSIGD